MLSAVDFIRAQLKRMHAGFDKSLSDLTPEQLHAVPGGHAKANTIGWGIWHYVRTEDNIVRWVIQNRRPPIWVESGYATSSACPRRPGHRHVHGGRPGAAHQRHPALPRVHAKVWAGTEELFASASPISSKDVTVKPLGDMSVVQCLGQVGLTHGMTHLGEIELARTLRAKTVGIRSARTAGHALRLADPRALAVGGRRLHGHRGAARPGVPGRGVGFDASGSPSTTSPARPSTAIPSRSRARWPPAPARAHRLRGDPARAPPSRSASPCSSRCSTT